MSSLTDSMSAARRPVAPKPKFPKDSALPRRTVAAAALAPYLTWACIVVAAVLILAYVWQAGMFAALMPRKSLPIPDPPKGEKVNVSASTITGFNRDNEPYKLTARSGVEDKDKPNLVHLTEVTGQMKKNSGDLYRVVADRALYDSDAHKLDLDGSVRLISEGKYLAELASAKVDIKAKTLRSEVPVKVTFDRGTIDAHGLEMSDDGNRILFFNGVKALFKGSATNATEKGDEQP